MATIEEIKELRKLTGAGVNAVREALDASNGNFDEAVKYLRSKGMAKAEKRKGKVAENGILGTYVHSNSKFMVVVEVACETDFAAKSEDMVKFANGLALHIAAVNPKYVNVESIDKDVLAAELKSAEQGLEGKPENIKQTIIDGKLEKFYKENVLLKQNYFEDESKTVEDLLNEMLAKIGEKIEVTYFYKFSVGEEVLFSVAKSE
jgi:elongation factor Ts